MSKFFEFKNITETEADLYIYGDIIGDEDYRASESDVSVKGFKEQLDAVKPNSTLKIYINSGGGDVFAAVAMTNLIRRVRSEKNIKVHSYIDGLSASAASYFPFVSDETFIYPTSVLMIHKPMVVCIGVYNATELAHIGDRLDKIEEATLIPCYKEKLKEGITDVQLRHMIADETWMSADDILNNFDGFTLLDEEGPTNKVESGLLNSYAHVPEQFKNTAEDEEDGEETEEVEETQDENIEDDAQGSDVAESEDVSDRTALTNLYKAKVKILKL